MRTTAITLAILAILGTGCRKNEITGRRKMNVVPDGVMNNLGKEGYAETLASADVQKGGDDVKVLNRVGGRISTVANEKKFAWEYSLIKDPTIKVAAGAAGAGLAAGSLIQGTGIA